MKNGGFILAFPSGFRSKICLYYSTEICNIALKEIQLINYDLT